MSHECSDYGMPTMTPSCAIRALRSPKGEPLFVFPLTLPPLPPLCVPGTPHLWVCPPDHMYVCARHSAFIFSALLDMEAACARREA